MARRRYQKGSVFLRGKKHQVWVGRWREDVIGKDGSVRRIRKNEVLGTRQELATQRLALRELERRLSHVNDLRYRPLKDETFAEFAAWWKKNVLPNYRPSTRSAVQSQLKNSLIPYFGSWPMRDIDYTSLQAFVNHSTKSPKTRRNHVLTLQMMWQAAMEGHWVDHKPFGRLRYPPKAPKDPQFYTAEEAKLIIGAASGQFKTLYWLAAETGLRSGELAGLRLRNLDLANFRIHITHSVWGGRLQEPKTANAKRTIAISPALAEHLMSFLQAWKANEKEFLFSSPRGGPIHPTTIKRRNLTPLCKQLGIQSKAMQGFRHGCATMMDHANVPEKVRQERLGHAPGSKVTMVHYTHSLPADHQAAAAAVGGMLTN